jgi:hypothetical protein
MAKRSSRKSSSGDEALLWGIAAVVVAVAGVGTAIMLTRRKSVCGDVQCSTGEVKNPKAKSTKDCCVKMQPPTPVNIMGCISSGESGCTAVNCTTIKEKNKCNGAGKGDNSKSCCTWLDPKPPPPTPVTPTDPYCYIPLRQKTGKDVKYFVLQRKNKNTKDGTCPQGWLAQPNAGLSTDTYTRIEEKGDNECYNSYLWPTDYTKAECLQAGQCSVDTSFTDEKCRTKWTPPACKVKGENGTCKSKVNSQGKRNCVGSEQLCGVNIKIHAVDKHKSENTCEIIFDKYNTEMIQCDNGYTAYVEQDNQGNCLFKCGKAKCCGGDECAGYSDKESCNGKAKYSNPLCYWDETGKCEKENFRMRRRRR